MRFYERVREAADPVTAIRALDDEEVVQALAAATEGHDSYLSNVLATEVMNRMRRSRTAASSMAMGVYAFDRRGRATYANPAAERLLGWTLADLADRDLDETVHVHAEPGGEKGGPPCPLRGVLETRTPSTQEQAPFRRKDGSETAVAYVAAPVLADDEVEGGVVVFRDVSARLLSERRLAAEHAVTRVLAEAPDLESAAPRILAAVAGSLGWDAGAIWIVDPRAEVLRLVELWHASGVEVAEFERTSRALALTRGRGLPGRVWATRAPEWIRDVTTAPNFPRAAAAATAGIYAAFGFPLVLSGEVLGVIEFFVREVREPDEELLAMMASVGSQIGQFIERKRAESELRANEARVRAMLEASLDAVVTMDHEGRVVEFNPAAERIFGYARADVVGREMAEFIVPPRLRDAHRNGLARYLRTGDGPVLGRRLEFPAVRADGTEFPAEIAILPIATPGPPMFTGFIRDVSGIREAEAEMRRLASIVEQSEDAIIMFDLEGTVTAWNRGAEHLYGYTADEMRGRSFRVLVPPGLEEEAEARLARLRRGEGAMRQETKRRRKDGTLVDVSLSVSPVRDATGRVVAISVIARDVTDRRLVEAALRASDERYRLMLESVEDYAIVTLDREGHITSWHGGAEQVHGYTHDEAVGRPFSLFFPPEDVAARVPERELALAAEHGRIETEGWRVRRDGRRFWADVVITSQRDHRGRLVGFTKITRDLTPRKQAEEVREEAKRQIERILESMTDSFFALDPAWRVTYVNRAAETLLGRRREELLGRDIWEIYPEAVGGVFHQQYQRAMRDQVAASFEEYYEPLGIWFEVNAYPSAEGLSVYFRDVSERKRGEEADRRAREELERRVEERTRELRAANEELEAFSYSVSHDLRAPLRGIEYLSRLLLEEAGPRLTEEERESAERLAAEGARLSQLVNDLLTMSRIAKSEPVPEEVDLSALARMVVDELRRGDPTRRVDVVVEEGLRARADPRLLRIVLENLLGNAWKYTSRTPRARIEVGHETRDGATFFFVRDNGAGFDPAKADRLFTPFARLHPESEFGGTGVGLATVQRIVARHGGRVTAEGRPGEGATFRFSLEGPSRR